MSGVTVFEFTVTVEVLIHPLTGSVAVTVYVPAAVTVAGLAAFTNEPPFHTIEFPELVPVSIALANVQLILLLLTDVTVGGVLFAVTITEDVLVHNVPGSVAVTVYVPAAVTVAGLAAFTNEPPFHTIVFPGLVPVNVALGEVQVILLLLTDVTVGGGEVDITVTVVVLLQLLQTSVIVTV